MTQIANTGERILLEKETPLMIARHFCAYKFAKGFVAGKSVLDIGSGEGYGSSYLADFAKEVMGIDYDPAIIDYARNKYHKDNLSFSCLDVEALGTLNRKFGMVCSFQNIEHISNTHKLLNNIVNLLKGDGVFICSTCNMKDASPGRSTPFNKFHVKEYLLDEFRSLVEKQFHKVEIFGLKRGFALNVFRRLKKIGLFNFLPERVDPVKRFFAKADCNYFLWDREDIANCLDFIAVCRK